MARFVIEKKKQIDDGIGGFKEEWSPFTIVEGYMDLVNGTDINTVQQAFVEESTHILIIPKYTRGITDDMRIKDGEGRLYAITYPDNPVGQNHHNEVYCKFIGVKDHG